LDLSVVVVAGGRGERGRGAQGEPDEGHTLGRERGRSASPTELEPYSSFGDDWICILDRIGMSDSTIAEPTCDQKSGAGKSLLGFGYLATPHWLSTARSKHGSKP